MDCRLKNESQSIESRSQVRSSDRLDIIGVWLLLLFIAVFFSIAAEEANKPSVFATSHIATLGASNPARMLMGIETSSEQKESTKEPRK